MSSPVLDEDGLLSDLLVEWSLLTREQLASIRAGLPRDRTPPVLARDLFQRGLLSPVRLIEALQGRTVPLRCVPCGRLEPTPGWEPGREVPCSVCGAPLRLPGIPPGLLGSQDPALTQRLSPTGSDARDTQAARTLHRAIDTAGPERPPPGTAFGRYRLLERLGEGGMGVVWKALDTELDRVVALKQIRGDAGQDGDTVRRFQREARLAAALRHPGIVAIHDVGEVDGKPYLTMDWVDGSTFEAHLDGARESRRSGERPDPERLRRDVAILAAVADAVAHAHEHGVIHRDLKHGNVLLDRDDRPCVMDFGLACEMGGPVEPAGPSASRRAGSLTLDGQTLGTPMFMSPEQARGQRAEVGVRSDVWSLGVMLYDLLCGQTPFEHAGNPWEIMVAVVKEDPTPPRARNPHLPRELEAVALKALEKPAERRYRSAREFSEELRRWLRGDPVEARRPGMLYRFWRKTAAHPRVAAGIAVAVLLIGGAGGVAWRARATSDARERETREARRAAEEAGRREQAKQEALVAQLRNVSGLALTAVLELRRNGIAGRNAPFLAALEQAFADVRLQAPELAEPWFHRGRLLRALHRTGEALEAQEEALKRDPRLAPALYERAVLCLQRFQARLPAAYLAAMAAAGERRAAAGGTAEAADLTLAEVEAEDEELRRWKEAARAALSDLQAELARDPSWDRRPEALLRVHEARLECVGGMHALFGTAGPAAARARLERAIALDPDLEEAFDALYAAAYQEVRWDRAEEACTRGLEHDLGWLPFWENRGIARMSLGADPNTPPARRDERFAAAIADFDRALALEPRRAESLRLRGGARAMWAPHRSAPWEEIEKTCRSAIDDLDACLALEPGNLQAMVWRGTARLSLSQTMKNAGRDPSAELAAAIEDFDRAIASDPRFHESWTQRATARFLQSQGAPPDSCAERLGRAEEDFTRSLTLHPGKVSTWRSRGTIRLELGRIHASAGRDPAEAWDGAVTDLQQAIRLQPKFFDSWIHLGDACERVALWRAARGEDPSTMLEQAVASFRNAAHLAPERAEPHISLGGFWLNWGNHLAERARDAAKADAAFARALDVFGKAIELAPADPQGWQLRALTRRNRGWVRSRSGGDPQADYAAAQEDLRKAAALGADPEQVRALLEQLDRKD